MSRKREAALTVLETLERLSAALDEKQAVINKYRNILPTDRIQQLQNEVDRKRFDVELDKLVVRAKLPRT